jgi:hypothetical protein
LGESNDSLDDHLTQSKIKLNDSGINVNSREVECVFVDSFARKLVCWAFNNATMINGLNTVSTLRAFVDVSYIIKENIVASECHHLHYLIKLDWNGESLLAYTQAFNRSYDYWKNDISLKAAANWHLESLQWATPSTELYSN